MTQPRGGPGLTRTTQKPFAPGVGGCAWGCVGDGLAHARRAASPNPLTFTVPTVGPASDTLAGIAPPFSRLRVIYVQIMSIESVAVAVTFLDTINDWELSPEDTEVAVARTMVGLQGMQQESLVRAALALAHTLVASLATEQEVPVSDVIDRIRKLVVLQET